MQDQQRGKEIIAEAIGVSMAQLGEMSVEQVFQLLEELPPEKNAIIYALLAQL